MQENVCLSLREIQIIIQCVSSAVECVSSEDEEAGVLESVMKKLRNAERDLSVQYDEE